MSNETLSIIGIDPESREVRAATRPTDLEGIGEFIGQGLALMTVTAQQARDLLFEELPAGFNGIIRESLSAAQPSVGVQYLEDGTRYKVAVHEQAGTGIYGLPLHLNGQWVALVDATDGKHLSAAPAQPAEAVPSLERSYDQRANAIIAFNSSPGDLDDKLQAAWEVMLKLATRAPAAEVKPS